MPINKNLNIAPYFDDFNIEKQFYKILFKPAYAVQARELTQLQTILQNQVEQFGDNIYQEGSIVKGCNFTSLDGLQYVKLTNSIPDPEAYIPVIKDEVISGTTKSIETKYEVVGQNTGLIASIISAARGFETRPPNLNTFFINYLNTNVSDDKEFESGEPLIINKYRYDGSTLIETQLNVATAQVTNLPAHAGKSFGIQAAAGVVFQKGHFLFAADQTLIVAPYTNLPDDLSVGYEVTESIISSLQDTSLFDNANGSENENAPGADRFKMVPILSVKSTAVADIDAGFFTLIRYQNGSAVTLRDVAQFNSINEELAKRTYETNGDYIVDDFKVLVERRGSDLTALVGKGSAYIKGYKVENKGFQDTVISDVSTSTLQTNESTSLNYGSYVDVTTIAGTIGLNYETLELQRANGTKIGEAFAKNITPTRLYLFGVKLLYPSYSFANVEKIVGTAGEITIPLGSQIKGTNDAPMIFDTGSRSVKALTDLVIPIRTLATSVSVSGNEIVINAANGNEDFAVDQSDIVVVDASNTRINVLNSVTSLNNSVLTISLDPADNSDPVADVYYNKRIFNNTDVTAYNKSLVNPYIKFTYATNKSQYSLGFPDVYSITSIEDVNGDDYTDSFRLNTNQKDNFYDISFIELIPGRPVPAAGTCTVRLKVFKISGSQTGSNFFTVASYPVDDATAILPSEKIRTSDMGIFKSTTGTTYRLRECIDFRPYADLGAGASYTALTPGAASVISGNVGASQPTFSSNDYVIPQINGDVTSDVETWNSRIDAVIIDSYGKVTTVQGKEETFPSPPKVGSDQFLVAHITIPGYPALSPAEALNQSKSYYAVTSKPAGTKTYTMNDISDVEKRVENLEYYVSLSQLEQETQNMNIVDENGLTRFKNGILVDPFNDTNISNLENPNFNAAIRGDTKTLTPALRTFPLDLKYKSTSSASIFPTTNDADVASIVRNDNKTVLSQTYATNFRNCVSNYWSYDGVGQLSPDHDMAHDVETNPMRLDIDIATPFNNFVDDLQAFIPMTRDVVTGTNRIRRNIRNNIWQDITSTTTQNTSLNTGSSQQNTAVGDFVSDIQFEPYMRARDLKVYMSGLRPNTRHYFFFDKVNVDDKVRPGTTEATRARDVEKFGELAAPVTTDVNGVLRAVFELPSGTFFVGERQLTVVDVDTYSNIDSAKTSRGDLSYNAYNINIDKVSLTSSVRMPETSIIRSSTTRTVVGRPFAIDPLAQTFFIKEGMGKGATSIFASKVDLFFKRKSEINGVTVMLREVINGYPSPVIIPFTKTHLDPSDVNVSDDASLVTQINFAVPIRLDVEKEYAIVIQPDANDPNYLAFTSKVGGTDLTPGQTNGQAVVQDWGDGVLFTSTNNRAWKSVQDEDLKFTLYRHQFSASSGEVTLTNNNHEFLTLSDWNGRFIQGEEVYQSLAFSGSTANNITMVNGTAEINGTSLSDTFAAGDKILITNSGGSTSEIFTIASVDSATLMTTTKPVSFEVGAGTCLSIVSGQVSYYNGFNRSVMHLQDSSATSAKQFSAGGTITGNRSGITGTIGSVDNINLSYIQPLINKSSDSGTTVSLKGTFVPTANVLNTYDKPMKFGSSNYFAEDGVVVYSKSNDPSDVKPFEFKLNMTNGSSDTTSPIIDLETANIMAYQWLVTNNSDTSSRYISKTVELAEDLDAEDINVILTANRPTGTDIKVYIRPQNVYDAAAFDTIPWIELELYKGINMFTAANQTDYREYYWKLPEANKDSAGSLVYTSTGGTHVGYRKYSIKIEMISNSISKTSSVRDMRAIALT